MARRRGLVGRHRRLPDGRQLVSKENLLERRKGQVQTGEDTTYGMGLVVSSQYGIPVVSHGGSLFGYKSDMIFLPDHGVGAVILTNSDTGRYLTGLFRRRLLEVLFDGKPEAIEQAKAANAQRLANIAKNREQLMVPADPAEVHKLATGYSSPALGAFRVRVEGGATISTSENGIARLPRARMMTGPPPSSRLILRSMASFSS